jgi:hypothetical protein
MKLKILQDCRWAQQPHEPQLSFKKDDVVEVQDYLAKDMIKEGHAEMVTENKEAKLEDSKREDKLADTKEEKKSKRGRKPKKRGER